MGRATDLDIEVDGRLDDWQGKGLVTWDRYGDGALDHPSLDIIGVYQAEDNENWYFFIVFGRDFRAAPPGGRFYFRALGWTPSDGDQDENPDYEKVD